MLQFSLNSAACYHYNRSGESESEAEGMGGRDNFRSENDAKADQKKVWRIVRYGLGSEIKGERV